VFGFGFELKLSIFEALPLGVFGDRNFKDINNKDLKPYWQIQSQNLSELE